MLNRIRSMLPTHPCPRTQPSFASLDRDAIFIITNNRPQRVNRIQVISALEDIEHAGERPQPGSNPHNELPLVTGLRQPHAQDGITPGNRNNPMGAHSQFSLVQQYHDGENDGDGNRTMQPGRGLQQQSNKNGTGNGSPYGRENTSGTRKRRRDALAKIKVYEIPTFLHTHFDIMYYLGICPIKGNGQMGSTLHMVIVCFVTLMAMLSTFARCKKFIVDEAHTGDLRDYVYASYLMGRMALQLGFVWLLIFRNLAISDLLQDTMSGEPGIKYTTRQSNISMLSVLLSALSLCVALFEAIRLDSLSIGLLDGGEDIILSQSHRTSMLFFLWTRETNGTDNFEKLYTQYGEELTPTTISFGVFGMIMTFAGYMQEIAIKDILLTTSLHTFRIGQIFQSSMISTTNESPANDQLTSKLRKIQKQLSDMSDDIDSCFGNLFKLIHADYLLYCAYFMAYLLKENLNPVHIFEGIMILVKIVCTLYFSSSAIEKSHAVKDAIREKYCDDDYPNDVNLKKVMLLIHTLEEHPITIGHGNFTVDETFALKFVGAAVTFFLFFIESDKEKEQLRRR